MTTIFIYKQQLGYDDKIHKYKAHRKKSKKLLGHLEKEYKNILKEEEEEARKRNEETIEEETEEAIQKEMDEAQKESPETQKETEEAKKETEETQKESDDYVTDASDQNESLASANAQGSEAGQGLRQRKNAQINEALLKAKMSKTDFQIPETRASLKAKVEKEMEKLSDGKYKAGIGVMKKSWRASKSSKSSSGDFHESASVTARR